MQLVDERPNAADGAERERPGGAERKRPGGARRSWSTGVLASRRGRWVAGILTGVVVLASASIVTGVALQTSLETPRDSGGSASSLSSAVGSSAGGAESGAASGSAAGMAAPAAPLTAESAPDAGLTVDRSAPGVTPSDLGSAGLDVIRTARLSLEVQDPVVAADEVRRAVAAAGGFVAEERSGTSSAGFTLRVPTDRLDALTERLGTLGTITARGSEAQDVGGQVADLDGRIAAQQASVARVRGLLDRATTINEIVSIESELASREADLESLQRRVTLLRGQVSLATVEVSVSSAVVAAPPAAGGFLGGLAVGLQGLQAIGAALLATLGFVVPMLPIVAVLVGLAWLVRRAVVRRRRPEAPPAAQA